MALQDRLQLQPLVFEGGQAFVQSHGIEYLWDPQLQGGALDLEFGSDFERVELDCVLSHLAAAPHQELVFIDIGGNCGLYSLNVARHFPGAHCYSFEPVPSTRALLTANVRRNGLADQVTIVSKALGDEEKMASMTASYSAMDHLIPGKASDELSPLIIEVQLTTLDGFVGDHDLKRADFIKCDVEGAELLAFKGAQKTLERFHPPILVEIEERHTTRCGYAPSDLDEFLRSYDYVPWTALAKGQSQKLTNLSDGIAQGYNNFLYLADVA